MESFVDKPVTAPVLLTRVRIKNGGQIVSLLPDRARAMILGGTAEEVDEKGKVVETAAIDRSAQTGMRDRSPLRRVIDKVTGR